MNVYAALFMLTLFGLGLIWKGLTGDVLRDGFGQAMLPRWAYILGGIVLLVFPVVAVLIRTESGRSFLGL